MVIGIFIKGLFLRTTSLVATFHLCNFPSGNFLNAGCNGDRVLRLGWARGPSLWLDQNGEVTSREIAHLGGYSSVKIPILFYRFVEKPSTRVQACQLLANAKVK